ncbi:hemerythrin domain-containing protein [uncultured Friedmanniella sp.]|uniref:hemerythrin domain-containing protein n=1 Tax=uncultured Friedmanniella sp. TaxID=335381 RepID=UPI0035CAB61B
MVVVHTAMLREFRLASAAVARTLTSEKKRVRLVSRHLRFLCDLLHHHHQGEDDLLWPKLRQRTQPAALQVIEEVEAQHEDIDAMLGRVEQFRTAWAEDPGTSNRDRLVEALTDLYAVLRDHLELEERVLLPLAATVLTTEEWHAVGAAGAASIPKPALPLVLGMFAYEGDPVVVGGMLSSAPLPVRVLVPLIGARAHARRARQIHGTARP